MKLNRYYAYSFGYNLINSIQFVVSSHSMLSVVSDFAGQNRFSEKISDSPRTTSVISTYIGKDIIGQTLGGLYNYYYSKYIDSNISKTVNKSLFLQNAGAMLECMSPLICGSGMSFFCVAGLSNVMKNVSFTQTHAINYKLLFNLLNSSEIAGVYSKLSVINSIASSLGMTLGILLTTIFSDPISKCILMGCLSFTNVIVYKKFVKEFN